MTEGQELELRIIRIDTDKRRMGLSLKQVLPEEEAVEFDWEPAPLEENSATENEVTAENAEEAVGAQAGSDGEAENEENVAPEVSDLVQAVL